MDEQNTNATTATMENTENIPLTYEQIWGEPPQYPEDF